MTKGVKGIFQKFQLYFFALLSKIGNMLFENNKIKIYFLIFLK